jgi:hypothetical protein
MVIYNLVPNSKSHIMYFAQFRTNMGVNIIPTVLSGEAGDCGYYKSRPSFKISVWAAVKSSHQDNIGLNGGASLMSTCINSLHTS